MRCPQGRERHLLNRKPPGPRNEPQNWRQRLSHPRRVTARAKTLAPGQQPGVLSSRPPSPGESKVRHHLPDGGCRGAPHDRSLGFTRLPTMVGMWCRAKQDCTAWPGSAFPSGRFHQRALSCIRPRSGGVLYLTRGHTQRLDHDFPGQVRFRGFTQEAGGRQAACWVSVGRSSPRVRRFKNPSGTIRNDSFASSWAGARKEGADLPQTAHKPEGQAWGRVPLSPWPVHEVWEGLCPQCCPAPLPGIPQAPRGAPGEQLLPAGMGGRRVTPPPSMWGLC